MKFTVISLFNHHAFDLEKPHYAVVMDAPETLGGGLRVLDLIPAAGHLDVSAVRKGFQEAAKSMPFRRTAGGGGEIDFLNNDSRGNLCKPSRSHIPARPLAGKGFVDSYFDWLCWRARVGLWLQGTKQAHVSETLAARVLEAAVPCTSSAMEGVPPYKAPARTDAPGKSDSKPARPRRAPLTQEAAPL